MEITEILIPAAAGLLSGIAGSLVAPWVQWGIEGRRERVKCQRDLISMARSALANPPPKDEFRKSPLYFQLKPFLSESTNRVIMGEFDEHGNEVVELLSGPYEGVNPYAHLVLEDLCSKEKKWRLVE